MLLRGLLLVALLFAVPMGSAQELKTQASKEPGLLFYLSGDHGFKADYSAGGTPEPNFLSDCRRPPRSR